MFEQTFVDGVGQTKRPVTIILSFAIQIVAIGVLVIIPLIYYDALPGAQLSSLLVAPPPPPASTMPPTHTSPSSMLQCLAPNLHSRRKP